MNILIFTDSFWPNVDGVATTTLALSKELARMGNNIVVVTLGDREDVTSHEGVKIIRFKGRPLKRYPNYKILLLPPFSKLRDYVDFDRVDLIHSQSHISMGFMAYFISQVYDIPLVATLHTLLPNFVIEYIENEKNRESLVIKILDRLGVIDRLERLVDVIGWKWMSSYYRLSDVVIVPSDFVKGFLKKKGVGKIVRIYHGLKREKTKSVRGVEKRFGLKGKFVVLHVGRLSAEKRVDLVIRAFKEAAIWDSVLIITSKGPAMRELKILAKKINIVDKIVFTGFLKRSDLLALYKLCDVFISPSLYESFNVSAAEAMLYGKPLVCSRAGAHKDLVKHGFNGFFVSHSGKEVFEYAKRMRELYEKKGLRKRMGKHSKEIARSMTFGKSFDKYMKTYEGLVRYRPRQLGLKKVASFTEYLFLNYLLLLVMYSGGVRLEFDFEDFRKDVQKKLKTRLKKIKKGKARHFLQSFDKFRTMFS